MRLEQITTRLRQSLFLLVSRHPPTMSPWIEGQTTLLAIAWRFVVSVERALLCLLVIHLAQIGHQPGMFPQGSSRSVLESL